MYTFISFRAIDLFVSARDWPFVYFQKNPRFGKIFISAIIFILYNVYFIGTMVHQANQNVEFRYWEFCDGHGLLIIITAMVYFGLFYYNIFIPLFGEKVYNNVFKPVGMLNVKYLIPKNQMSLSDNYYNYSALKNLYFNPNIIQF